MIDSNATCAVVLSGGTAASVAPALAKLFGIEARLAGQIAGAAPIVLVDNLTESQAAGVSAALAEMTAAGARLEVKAGAELGSLPRVGWPGGPKINGRPAAEYAAPAAGAPIIEGQLRCPCCGANLRLVAAAGSAAAPAPSPAMGRKDKKDSGFEEIPLPEALKSLDAAPSELPDVPEVPEAKPVKAKAEPQPPPPTVKGAISVKNAKPGSSAPMALEDFEAGLASDDQLMADLDDGLPQVPDEKARPVPVKPAAPAPIRTEDINVMPEAARPAAGAPKAAMVKPMTPQQAARQAVAKPAAPAARPATIPPAAARPATVAPAAPPVTAASGDPNEKVNIYINKTNNPKVHELLAKIHNIPVEEAAEMANRTLVTVARGIGRPQAETIKRKLAEYKVSARLSAVRLSQRLSPEGGGDAG